MSNATLVCTTFWVDTPCRPSLFNAVWLTLVIFLHPDSFARSAACNLCAQVAVCPLGRMPLDWREAVGDALTPTTLRRATAVVAAGEMATQLLFVKGGLVLMRQAGPDGVDRAVGLMGRGTVMGLLAASDAPSVLSLTTVTDVPVCAVSLAVLKAQGLLDGRLLTLLADSHAKGLGAVAHWGQVVRVRQLAARVASAMWLLAQTQNSVRLQMPGHGVLAELLSVTRESVGRTLGELERQGALQRNGRYHMDVNMPVLMAMVGAVSQPPR